MVLVILASPAIVYFSSRNIRYDAASVPARRVVLVLGAGLQSDGTPTDYLKRRIETGVDILRSGRAEIMLMSGDNRYHHYNEPEAMKRYALSLGVGDRDIALDYGGYNTYDSCHRAKSVFELDEVIIVTQGYHLSRALFACNNLGIDSVGVAAKQFHGRDFTWSYIVRELASTNKAVVQSVLKPRPAVQGEPVDISMNRISDKEKPAAVSQHQKGHSWIRL